MAIVKSIEKYLDYYNKYMQQSLTLAEKTTDILRKQKVNELTSEAIKNIGNVKSEEDLYKIQRNILETAYSQNMPEVAENIKQVATIKQAELKETKENILGEEIYKTIQPDEFRIVNGKLKSVKEIIDESKLKDPKDILSLLSAFKKPERDRGVNIVNDNMSLVESYIDPDTKAVLESKVYPVKNVNGQYVYVDDKNADNKIDNNEMFSLLPREANYIFETDMRKRDFALRQRQQQLYEEQNTRELTLNQVKSEFDIAKEYDKMFKDYYVQYKLNYDEEIKERYDGASNPVVRQKIIESIEKDYYAKGGALNQEELKGIFDKFSDARNIYEKREKILENANIKYYLVNKSTDLPNFQKNFSWYETEVAIKGSEKLVSDQLPEEDKIIINNILNPDFKKKYPTLYVDHIDYLSKKLNIKRK